MSYELGDYASMVADPVRGAAYLHAIRSAVKPGDIVADIGAGPGILGVYAALLGARRVFLIEPDESVEVAMALAKENGVDDRVEVIRDVSMHVKLPELADVIISDLRGVLPFFGGHLEASADMRARLLKPGGVCIPQRDTMFLALTEDAASHDARVNTLRGVPEIAHVSLDRLLANRWFRVHAAPEYLLTSAEPWLERTVVTREGTVHGMLCWFDTMLTDDIGFSNAPTAPRALYGQAMFPVTPPLHVMRGDSASVRLRAVCTDGEYLWSWQLRVERNGSVIAEARHSSLEGLTLSPSLLARRAEDFVPRPNADAAALQLLLNGVDGRRSLRDIAALLHERLPERFRTVREALTYASAHEHLWR